jgi:hypothetical protein
MGFDPQKRLAKGDETGNVKNRICCELVKLHTIYKEKPTKELVGRERKTVQEKGKEHHPVAARGLGDALDARKDDLITIGDETISNGLVEICLLELRGHLVARCIGGVGFPHLVLLCTGLEAHLQATRGGCAGAQKHGRIATMVVVAEARNW